MANQFTPKQIELSKINDGFRYENGQGISAETINSTIEASAWAQSIASQATQTANQAEANVRRIKALAENQPVYEQLEDNIPRVLIEGEGEDIWFKFINIQGDTPKVIRVDEGGTTTDGGKQYTMIFDTGGDLSYVTFVAPRGEKGEPGIGIEDVDAEVTRIKEFLTPTIKGELTLSLDMPEDIRVYDLYMYSIKGMKNIPKLIRYKEIGDGLFYHPSDFIVEIDNVDGISPSRPIRGYLCESLSGNLYLATEEYIEYSVDQNNISVKVSYVGNGAPSLHAITAEKSENVGIREIKTTRAEDNYEAYDVDILNAFKPGCFYLITLDNGVETRSQTLFVNQLSHSYPLNFGFIDEYDYDLRLKVAFENIIDEVMSTRIVLTKLTNSSDYVVKIYKMGEVI